MESGAVFVKDEVEVYVRRGGMLVLVARSEDLVTNAGLSKVVGLVFGMTTTPFSYVAIGTGTRSPSPDDTSLENEIARSMGSASYSTTYVQNDTVIVTATFLPGSNVVLSESGIFDSPSGGTMLCRSVFKPAQFLAGEEILIKWRITVRRR